MEAFVAMLESELLELYRIPLRPGTLVPMAISDC